MTITPRFQDNSLLFKFDKSLNEIIEDDLYNVIRKEIKEVCNSKEITDKIHEEIVRYLDKAESKEVLTRIIAEVVSETIKTTIMELKQQGVI